MKENENDFDRLADELAKAAVEHAGELDLQQIEKNIVAKLNDESEEAFEKWKIENDIELAKEQAMSDDNTARLFQAKIVSE